MHYLDRSRHQILRGCYEHSPIFQSKYWGCLRPLSSLMMEARPKATWVFDCGNLYKHQGYTRRFSFLISQPSVTWRYKVERLLNRSQNWKRIRRIVFSNWNIFLWSWEFGMLYIIKICLLSIKLCPPYQIHMLKPYPTEHPRVWLHLETGPSKRWLN